MKKEEHKAILDKIKNAPTDADRMALLVELENDYSSVLTERDTAVTEKNSAVIERDKYAKLNNELWLQNSSQEELHQNNINNQSNNNTETEPPKKRTFADLEAKINEEYGGKE
jgi:hypothetical protein